MTKKFACGDVVEGCNAKFTGDDDGEVLKQVAQHAKEAHGMPTVPAEVVEQVRQKITEG